MSGSENAANTQKPLDIPKELWMMVDHLFRSAIKQVRKCVAFWTFFLFVGSYPFELFTSLHPSTCFSSFLLGQINESCCIPQELSKVSIF